MFWRLAVWGSAVWLASCGGGLEPKAQGVEAEAATQCLPEPAPAPASVFVPSTSQVAAVLTFSDDDLQRLFDDAVPTTVARDENVNAGAAGRASYEIKHRDVTYAHTKRGLELSTPLEAEIQLCKPLGAVCFGYGKCRPEWEATVTVPKHITPFQTPRVDLDLHVRKGCVLSPVRYDATSELKKVTDQQRRSIENQINRELGKYAKRLRASVAQWGVVRSKSGQCVELRPEHARVAISSSGIGEQKLHTLTAVTTGTVTAGCNASQLDPAFTVELSDHASSETRVVWEQTLPLTDVEQHLAHTAQDAEKNTAKQAEPRVAVTVRASGPELLIRLTPFGKCGSAWGRFVPEVTRAGVSLRAVHVSEPAVADWVNRRGVLFGAHTAANYALAEEVAQQTRSPRTTQSSATPAWTLVLTSTLKTQHTAYVVQNGVVLTAAVDGLVEARLQHNKK